MNNGDVGGSRGRGRGWHNPDNKPRELRRPKSVPDETKVDAPVSNLNAGAKEWYPPNYVPQSPVIYNQETFRVPRNSVQDRIRQAQDQDPYNFDNLSFALEEPENMELRQNIANLITVMCEITFDPGKFDTLCGPLVDSFAATLNDTTYTRAVVEAIVNQCIGEANFRYNGARLCSIFDSVASPEESTFRACLLERCSTEEHKIISGLETSEENMRGFAMFLAEIYTQLENSQGGRIRTLGESLCKVLLHLLDTNKETNIKSVCQLLKLSGIALDADCPTNMHAAFERLKYRAEMPCVRRVIQLRAARWGLADPEPDANSALAPNARRLNNRDYPESEPDATMGGYLADGQSLTLEERDFLQSNLPAKPAALDIDILEELENEAWDTGMDAEMQAGYLEFLKISNQIKR